MVAAGFVPIFKVASIAGKDRNPSMSTYSASKSVAAFPGQVGCQEGRHHRRAY